MTLEEEIVVWALGRPAWQRHVLQRLAHGEAGGPDDYRRIADALIRGDSSAFDGALTAADMPGAASHKRVRLKALCGIEHVNALVSNQQVTFGLEGLTVIYGDNGSGKSGYARLLKRMVRSRHREEVLTDIFEVGTETPTAQVDVEVDGVPASYEWPVGESGDLRNITFFDEACGDAYISHESAVSFRPAAIFILDGLIEACDRVRAEIDGALAENSSRARRLPEAPPGTDASRFLSSLSHQTTETEIDAACAVPEDVEAQIQLMSEEELRLRATDPTKERTRLQTLADRYQRVAEHFTRLEAVYGGKAATRLRASRQQAVELRAAARVASTASFDAEPVAGVGTQTWRALWEAARSFTEADVGAVGSFPHVHDGSRCVLCHQPLDEAARERLARFEAAVRDQTELQAAEAERSLAAATQQVVATTVAPPEVQVMLDDLEEVDGELVALCRQAFRSYATMRAEALDDAAPPAMPAAAPTAALVDQASEVLAAAANLDSTQFQQQMQETTTRRTDLEARSALMAVREDVAAEVGRRRERAELEAVKKTTDTSGVTRKSTELTRAHVTSIIRDRFTRESDRLRLERVTLEDVGGQKGHLRHRPAFVGAVQHPSMTQVLSEGEQTALGLAGYFTEAFLDDGRSTLVLDDPVCSLDHIRREHVARRLADFSKDRQVIVFTHDLAFVAELRRAADKASVAFAERTVERRGDERPGVYVEGHPWKTRDVKARLGHLEAELARIKGHATTASRDEYERDTADWAGKMSETWERTINLEVVGRVMDLTTLEVRPKMFRLLAAITTQDDTDLQDSYERCSRWARRHDKNPGFNYTPPTVGEMEQELALVRSWFERVRKYA